MFDSKEVLKKIIKKEKIMLDKYGCNYFNYSENGVYTPVSGICWTASFLPGIFWLLYRYSGDKEFMEGAVRYEKAMDKAFSDFDGLSHDVGFMWLLTSGQNFALTGSDESRRRLLKAAYVLMGRFNIAGNYIRAWNFDHMKGQAIIDCMMNIPLLFLASEITGDMRFHNAAAAYAGTALNYLIREDGSVHHVMCFDHVSGKHTGYDKGAGYDENSAWSRGAGWAIYGMAMAYMYTKELRFLEAAKKVSAYFTEHLNSDGVAPWDFKAPVDRDITDTSACMIAASGMLEIYRITDDAKYRSSAVTLIENVLNKYSCLDDNSEQLIGGGTVEMARNKGIMAGIIYGDYYLTEALLKLETPGMTLVWEENNDSI